MRKNPQGKQGNQCKSGTKKMADGGVVGPDRERRFGGISTPKRGRRAEKVNMALTRPFKAGKGRKGRKGKNSTSAPTTTTSSGK